MKIALCVKQVPDTNDIKWTENNTMKREGVESILNPCDVYATELALKLKKENNAEITVFTMGPDQAQNVLREIIAVGADKAILLSDKKFAGADTFATGMTISSAIKKILPDFDIIICGQYAIDGDTAQTGPCIAGLLNIPQVTYVKNIEKFEQNTLYINRELNDGIEQVKVEGPVLLCVLKSDKEPERATINGIIKAQDSEITILTLDDTELSPEDTGIKGSPTYVSKAFRPDIKHSSKKYKENGAEIILNTISEVINNG